jgi:hypothetical protein
MSKVKNNSNQQIAEIDVELQVSQLDPFQKELEKYKSRFENVVYDLDTDKGMKLAKSDSFEISKTASALEKKYKLISAPINDIRSKLLSKRAEIRDDLRSVQDRIKSQIKKHEEAKKAHLDMLQSKLDYIKQGAYFSDELITSESIKRRIDIYKDIIIDESYEHLKDDSIEALSETISKLKSLYDDTLQREKEKLELEELRALKQKKEQEERDRKIAERATEQAKIEAQKLLEQQRIKAEKEAQRKIEEANEQIRLSEIRAERAAKEERKKIEREQAEIRRQESEKLKLEDERKQMLEHRNMIHKQSKDSFLAQGFDDEQSTKLVTIIKDGLIDNVSINY